MPVRMYDNDLIGNGSTVQLGIKLKGVQLLFEGMIYVSKIIGWLESRASLVSALLRRRGTDALLLGKQRTVTRPGLVFLIARVSALCVLVG